MGYGFYAEGAATGVVLDEHVVATGKFFGRIVDVILTLYSPPLDLESRQCRASGRGSGAGPASPSKAAPM